METKKMTLKEAQELVKNTKYIVWNEDESRQLQEKLFEIGCEWIVGGQEVLHIEHPFLFVDSNLFITYVEKHECKAFNRESNQIKPIDDVVNIEIEIEQEPKPKFDPNTLQPFDKVLVRDYKDSVWYARFFEREEKVYKTTSGASWKYCIPYNDETKHLLGTTDEAPEFYKTWK